MPVTITVMPIITQSLSDEICAIINNNSDDKELTVEKITKYYFKIESYNTSVVKSVGNVGIIITVDGVDKFYKWDAKYASKFRPNLPGVVPVNIRNHIFSIMSQCLDNARKKTQLRWWDLQSSYDNPLSGTSSYVYGPKLSKSS